MNEINETVFEDKARKPAGSIPLLSEGLLWGEGLGPKDSCGGCVVCEKRKQTK